MSDRRSPARGARRFDLRGRRPTRVAIGLLGLGLIIALAVAASWRLSAPEPTGAPVSPPPDSEPTQLESVPPMPAASGPPAPVAGPTDFMPLCTSATGPGRAPSIVPPVTADVSFELVSQVGGPATAATIGDGYLFSAVGAGITVLDIRDPRRPSAIGATDALAAVAEDLSSGDRLLGVAIGEAGLALLETSDPTNPELLGSVPLPGYAEALALTDRYAFVADGPGGLRVVDVTDPQRATEIGVALDEHQAMGIAVTASHAYIAAGDEGLLVVDITDPVAPRQVGSLFTGGYAYGVAVSGDTAFLADGWGGLRLIDVGDPAQPRLLSTVETRLWALDVAAEGEWAYVAAGSEGLLVVDVRTPPQPEVVGTLTLPDGRATHVVVGKGLAYLTDALAGIHVVDVTEPKRPTTLQTQHALADVWDAKVVGRRAFVAGGAQGLRVLDVSDPVRPVEVAGVRTEIFLQDVAIVGNNVFASGGGGESGAENAIVGFDASDAKQPAHGDSYYLATRDFSGFSPGSRPAIQGASLYYPIEAGLLIVDGTSATPCEIGHLQTQSVPELEQGYLGGVAVAGDVVYLAALADGILVVDASVPSRPVLVRGVDADANVIGIVAAGPTLYAVDGGALVAFSLEDPRNPRRLGSMELPFESTGLAYAEGYLFVASQSALLAIDVSEPAAPRIAGRIDLPGVIARLTVTDRFVYVSLGAAGLAIVGWGPGPQARSSTADLGREHAMGAALVSLDPPVPADGQTRADSRAVGILASGAGLMLQAIPTPTSECRVTTTADNGPGSLRTCIGGADEATRISFDAAAFPITKPGIIRPSVDLPEVPPEVTIDGTGAGVMLDGQGQISVGLQLSDRDAVIGLHIRNFTNTGLAVGGSESLVSGNVLNGNGYSGIDIGGSGNRVTGNRIGTNPTGSKTGGFQPHGVLCQGDDNVIGGSAAADANVISGNQTDVSILGTGNLVTGNLIGTDATGTRVVRGAVPDDPDIGALKVRTTGHVISDNVIAGGVEFGDWAVFNSFIGNRVGVDRTGRALDCECGVRADTSFNRIGGTLPGEGNIIRGHLGIFTTDTVVLGNTLIGVPGVVTDLATAIGLADGARRNVIGGRSEGAANVMTGGEGVHIAEGAAHNVIIGNRISVTGDGIGRSGSRTNYVVANEISRS